MLPIYGTYSMGDIPSGWEDVAYPTFLASLFVVYVPDSKTRANNPSVVESVAGSSRF